MEYRKHVEYFFLALVCGIGSLGVSYVAKMSENISQMVVSVKELNVRMEAITDKLSRFDQEIRDHEIRLRTLETAKSDKR